MGRYVMAQFDDYESLQYLGKLKTLKSTQITRSGLGVGFECLDRDMWDPQQAWPVLEALGVKWARVQTGWAKTEKTAGQYDFAWLDEIVDHLLERGVTPWLSLSYGNPVHTRTMPSRDPRWDDVIECDATGVGFPPIHTEAERTAWQNYVRALVAHYRQRVQYYEVWNEPDLTAFWKCGPRAEEYADLVNLTAEPLREMQPDAKLIGGAIAWGMTVWSIKYLEELMQAGMHERVDIISYHGYKSIPERHSAQEIAAFRHVINRYKPDLEYWQGEAGCPSKVAEGTKGTNALTTMKISEPIQARMLLRRSLLELHHGCGMTSYFHMADFAHYVNNQNTFHYGLLRLEDGSPKPSYYAMQSLCTVLSEAVAANGRTACHASILEDTNQPRETREMTWHANFVKGDVPVHAWWQPGPVVDDPQYRPAELTFWIDQDLRLDHPVMIDPATQEVYAINFDMDKRTCGESWLTGDPEREGIRHFKPVPISNSPLMLTDRSIVECIA